MSPQIKRTAIGGVVVAVTSLLVLSAIAVAHRDSRNMDAESGPESPDYANKSVQPISAPAGMINPESVARKFPHADLDSATIEDKKPSEKRDFSLASNFPNDQFGSVERHSEKKPSAFAAKARERNEVSSYSNPLRAEVRLSDPKSHDAEQEDESQHRTNSEAQQAPIVSTAAYEHENNQETSEQSSGNATPEISVDESQVVTASGFDLPPSASAQPSNGTLAVPPPLPSFGNAPNLPPDLKQPTPMKTPASVASGPSLGSATLLPPTAAPSSTAATAPSTLLPSFNSAPPATLGNAPSLPSLGNASPSSLPSSTSSLPPAPPSLSGSNAFPSNSLSSGSALPVSNQLPVSAKASSKDPRGVPANVPPAFNSDTVYPSLEAQKLPNSNPSRGFNDPSAMVPLQSVPATRASLGGMSSAQTTAKFVSDRPGERVLDGIQVPNLQILKEAPHEIQVGHPATFTILVKNVGKAAAHDVVVQDVLPQGTTLHASNPQAEVVDGSHMVWNLGTLPAGAQQVLTVEAIPQQEGEIGSIATVQFKAQAGVRTVVTQPKLVVSQQADPTVLIGEQCRLRITITNDGTGVAYDVKVQEDVPDGFTHPQGDALGLSLNDLAPGQSRTFDLELEAKEPGVRQNTIRVIASNTEEVISDVNIEVIAPQLAVKAEGPRLRYLERQATYNVSVSNLGTATARNIELIAHLPRGLRFNSAGNQGEYLPDQHAVVWMLEELAANSEAKTDLVVMPVEEGDFVLRFQSRADRATAQPFEKQVRVDGQSELAFTVEDDNDPIEVDGQTTYMIRLNNVGTRRDTNIQVEVELPAHATLISMSADVEHQQRQNSIVFSPIQAMNPKDEKVFRFTVGLADEGMQMVRVNVKSDLRPVAVVKEESTQVYRDQ